MLELILIKNDLILLVCFLSSLNTFGKQLIVYNSVLIVSCSFKSAKPVIPNKQVFDWPIVTSIFSTPLWTNIFQIFSICLYMLIKVVLISQDVTWQYWFTSFSTASMFYGKILDFGPSLLLMSERRPK